MITEYPEDREPDITTFPQRNRIVSGLSDGVLVIEAKYRSGTSITANFAKSQGKPVFCIPNSIDSKFGIGTNNLLKQGAILVTSSEEIIEYFKDILPENNICEVKIKEEYKEIYEILKEGPQTIHSLITKSGKNISELNGRLTMMELEEIIIKLPGEEYKIIE